MKRRFIPLLMGLLVASSCAVGGRSADERKPPNVIVIVTDDQRARGTLSVMPVTKRLFKKEGTWFSNAVTTTPYCCPARASIFTGRYAHNHGVTIDMAKTPWLNQRSTLQRSLKRAGYRTGMFGKYLNGWDLSRDPPHFDEWAIFSYSKYGYIGGKWNVDGSTRKVDTYSTTYLGRRAAAFIRKAKADRRPWALFVSTAAPHPPYVPQKRYENEPVPPAPKLERKREGDVSDKPTWVKSFQVSMEHARGARTRQLRTLMSVDDLVERVFATVARAPGGDNTLSFYLSDNGHMWGEHNLVRKMAPYAMSVRIPLFVRWPGHFDSGDVDDRLAAVIDIAPTVLDVLGIESPAQVDGRSLVGEWERDRILTEFWARHNRPMWASLFGRRFLYVEYYGKDGKTITEREYYDLKRDPGERKNVLADRDRSNDPDLSSLSEELRRARRCTGSSCP